MIHFKGEKTLNGMTYKGEFDAKGKECGFGQRDWMYGSIKGFWYDGKMHGFGKQLF